MTLLVYASRLIGLLPQVRYKEEILKQWIHPSTPIQREIYENHQRGTAGVDVLTIAKRVASLFREHRENLALDHLIEIPGMGLAKAAQILSAFELARHHLLRDTVKIACAQDVLPLLADIAGKQQEHFVCISLNGANEVIEKRIVTIGLLDQSPVHPREVFADVIADRAAAVIFAHNFQEAGLMNR